MLTLAAHDPVDHVLPHAFFRLSSGNLTFGQEAIPLLGFPLSQEFWFTNQMLMTLLSAALCVLIFPLLARRYATVDGVPTAPRGLLANLFEALLQFIREEVARPVLKHRTDRFMPFLWTLFFFILFCNLLGLIPLADIVKLASGGKWEGVGGTATGNLAITGGLALVAFIVIHASGVVEVFEALRAGTYGHHDHGEHADHADADPHAPNHSAGWSPAAAALAALPLYIWNFAPHVFKPGPTAGPAAKVLLTGVDFVMWLFLLLLELIGAVIKPFALMIRLFANMIAGHIVLASILFLIFSAGTVAMGYTVGVISTLGCLAINCLELFVAFLQAYIFVFLTTLFLSMAVAPEH